jgi:GNAT superfamily N-acetyltransferase
MEQPEPRVVRLDRERFDDVVETLCEAFHEYPVMRYVLQDAGDEYDARLSRLIGYFTECRFTRNWPVLGVIDRGQLLAAANINPPQPAPPSPSLEQRYRQLRQQLGQPAIDRFDAFADAADPLKPDAPHYYLGMIGVRQRAQGRGYARLVLDQLHEMSTRDPGSSGVVLTTETPENLPLYEHFGYRVLGHARVGALQTWTLFRPNDPAAAADPSLGDENR